MRAAAIPLAALAVENLTVGRIDPVRLVEEAAAAGFGAVGLPLATATDVPLEHAVAGSPAAVAALRAALRRTGLRVLDVEAFVLAPGTTLEAWRPVLEAGAELGARWISVIGAPVGGPVLAGSERVALLGALCEAAAGLGLGVGVECMLYRDVRTLDEALGLIEAVGRPDVGIILDALHLHRAGTAASAVAALPPGRVAWAQLCDVAAGPAPALAELPREARTGRLHPGAGVADLAGFLRALPDGTALAVETPVAADAHLSTADRLRRAAGHAAAFLHDRATRDGAATCP